MKEIKKSLELSTLDYYETHLSIINCILPPIVRMTPMEIRVMACFMSLTGEVSQYRFGPTAKKVVMQTVNPKKPLSPAGLSNYIISLTNKKLIGKQGDVTIIHPLLVPEENEQLYRFRLINHNNININIDTQ